MSVPCGFSKAGTPIGMQIAAGPFQVDLIFTSLTPTNRRLSGTSGDQHNSIEIANNKRRGTNVTACRPSAFVAASNSNPNL